MDPDGGIGFHGHMPWKDEQELKLFRKLTMGEKIMMGKITWESLPGTLDGREVILVTHDQKYPCPKGVKLCHDPISMIQSYVASNDTLMIGGGRSLYELAMPYADVCYLSIMKDRYPCDISFPVWDKSAFSCEEICEFPTFIWYFYKRKRDEVCDL